MIQPITAEQIRKESLDEMRARHAQEIDAKLMELLQTAYTQGVSSAPFDVDKVPKIAVIHAQVAAKHNLTPREMMEKTQEFRIAHPRQEAFYRAHKAGYSMSKIARYFGGFDHTTVIHGIKSYQSRAAQ